MKISKRQLRRVIREAGNSAAQDRDDYQRGYEDGVEGFLKPHGESDAYIRGWEDGKLDSGYGQMWGGE